MHDQRVIAACDLQVGDQIYVGGEHAAFAWSSIRTVVACQVPVTLEGGKAAELPGRAITHGPMGLGMRYYIDQEGVCVRRRDPALFRGAAVAAAAEAPPRARGPRP